MKYRTIYADPAWPERGAGKIKRGADKHYPLMSIKEITDLGQMVRDVADPEGCHLYLWVTNNHLHDGLHVLEAWGFTYITTITWMKDRIGLGQYYRGMTEHCLFGRMGTLLSEKESVRTYNCPTCTVGKMEKDPRTKDWQCRECLITYTEDEFNKMIRDSVPE